MTFWLRVDPKRPRHPKWASLTAEEYRFADKVCCWGAENETEYIPAQALFDLAGSRAIGLRRAKVLVECGKHMPDPEKEGILEPADGGWRIHDAKQYWPPSAVVPVAPVVKPPRPPPKPERSAALSAAGKRGAAKRWTGHGHGGHPTGHPEAIDDGHRGHREAIANGHGGHPTGHPEAILADGSRASDLSDRIRDGNGNGRSEHARPKDLTGFPRAKGQRPCVRAGLLPENIDPKTWEPPSEFCDYALDLGLSKNEFADSLADMRQKVGRAGALPWLASQLCRFIEARAERKERKSNGKPARSVAPPTEREPHVEGEVCELADDERPTLPPPLRFRSWEIDPSTRRFVQGKDTEGALWFIDAERKLRRRLPKPKLVEGGAKTAKAGTQAPRHEANGTRKGGGAA